MAGIEDLPIEMLSNTLTKKSDINYRSGHPYDLEDVKDLPRSIQHPIAVFDSEHEKGHKVILTELKDKKGNNFVSILNVLKKRGRNLVTFNSVISLYPKESSIRIAKWFDSEFSKITEKGKRPLLRWADIKKASTWMTNHAADLHAVGLSSRRIAKLIKNFS